MVDSPVPLDASPADRIAAAVARWGEEGVVERAIHVLEGGFEGEDFLLYIGGAHAEGILRGAPALYWPEVWAARALGFVWTDAAANAITLGLANRAWRVREMCTRTAAQRGLPVSRDLIALLGDEVPRVRAAAARALGAIGGEGVDAALTARLTDVDVEVRRNAGASIRALAGQKTSP